MLGVHPGVPQGSLSGPFLLITHAKYTCLRRWRVNLLYYAGHVALPCTVASNVHQSVLDYCIVNDSVATIFGYKVILIGG